MGFLILSVHSTLVSSDACIFFSPFSSCEIKMRVNKTAVLQSCQGQMLERMKFSSVTFIT